MTSKNEKKSFVMYDSFLEAMKHLNDSEFRECVMKIRDYALDGDETESEHPMVNIIMALAKPNLDAARRRYMASVENGKKGAEFGKLGGAPKGNQNARKKQPLKQPLDVDANDNVDIEEDVNENVEVDVNGDALSGSKGFQSSFSNSSKGFFNKEIENDSERFEREENKEPMQEDYNFKGFELSTASDEEEEIHINSNSESNNTPPVSTHSVEGAGCSAARPQPKKEPGMDIGEYIEQCFVRCLSKLIDMRLGKIPNDDSVFWRAVDYYSQLYGVSDRDRASKDVTNMVTELMKPNV